MSCFDPEVLSRWVDGTLGRAEARAVQRHLDLCAACRAKADELRGVGEWLVRATEPGRACLSPEEIAAVLEGAAPPEHLSICPRCAAEVAALRPKKRPSRRITVRRQETGTGWFVAAASIAMAVVGLVFIAQQKNPENVARTSEVAPAETPDPGVRPAPPAEPPRPVGRKVTPEPEPLRIEPRPAPAPRPEPPVEKTEPKVEAPTTPKPPEPPAPTEPPRRTIVDGPAKVALSPVVKSGALSALVDGKWTAATRIVEGTPLRAEGKSAVEFAKARLTLDGGSRFALAKDEVSLSEGALSLDVQQGSGLSLVLGPCRIVPMASAGRVLLSAKPDRVVVDEGGARWQEIVLHQGVEHQVVKEKLEPQKKRSLAGAARPRETLTWRPDFKDFAVRSRIHGRIDALPEGTQVVSTPGPDKTYSQSLASFTAQDERGFFAVKANSAVRFRYFLSEPASLQLLVKNGTKDENFNLDLDPVIGKWTTTTILFKDIPVNIGGKKGIKFDSGDRVWTIGWFVGKPGSTATLTVDSLEVVEIDR